MSTITVPIYTIIINNLQDIDTSININDEHINQLLLNISNNPDTHEMIYTLIRQYQILNSSSSVSSLPYSTKYIKTKNGYKFDISILPLKLIYILIEFYKIHNNSIK